MQYYSKSCKLFFYYTEILTDDGGKLSGHDGAVDVTIDLLESRLHVQLVFVGIRVHQHEFAFAVERVLDVVEGDEVRVSEYCR